MTGSTSPYHEALREQAIRERPFAVAFAGSRGFRRKPPVVYAQLFKSANQALLYWVLMCLFWLGLSVSFVLLVLGVKEPPPVTIWAIPVLLSGVLAFLSERVEAPEGSDLQVGGKIGQSLVICRIGPTLPVIAFVMALLSVPIYIAREFGLF